MFKRAAKPRRSWSVVPWSCQLPRVAPLAETMYYYAGKGGGVLHSRHASQASLSMMASGHVNHGHCYRFRATVGPRQREGIGCEWVCCGILFPKRGACLHSVAKRNSGILGQQAWGIRSCFGSSSAAWYFRGHDGARQDFADWHKLNCATANCDSAAGGCSCCSLAHTFPSENTRRKWCWVLVVRHGADPARPRIVHRRPSALCKQCKSRLTCP